jgi:threonyl-tRNA synthetase
MAKSSDLQKDNLYKLRHSAAHVMAQAVLEIHPEAKIAIGPPIENGFYYDFDLGKDDTAKRAPSPQRIWSASRSACARSSPASTRSSTARSAPTRRASSSDQPYKLELIDGLEKGGIDEYGNEIGNEEAGDQHLQARQLRGPVPGPHVEHTGRSRPTPSS